MQFANNVNIFQRNLISAYGQSSPRYRQENIGGGINLIYVNEECFILENVTPQNMKTVYDKFRKELVSGSRVMIPNYIYNNKVCLLTVPKTTWENADWWAGMSQYWESGRAGKEVADMADSINIINTGYNALWSPVDKAFIERVKKIKNRALKDSLCMFYGSFKTKVLVEILAGCPYVNAVAGGLYLASFGCRMIFDFRGIVDSIKNSSEEELFILAGSLLAIGSSGKSIKKSFSGKKTTLGKGGALETKNVTNMKNQVAKDTAGQVLPQGTKPPIKTSKFEQLKKMKRLQEIKNILGKETCEKIYKNSANMPGAKSPEIRQLFYETMLEREAWRVERRRKLDSMERMSESERDSLKERYRDEKTTTADKLKIGKLLLDSTKQTAKAQKKFLKKLFYNKKSTINDKFEIARLALEYGHYDLTVSCYKELFKYIKNADKNKTVSHPGMPAEHSKGFKVACWADIYYSMHRVWKQSYDSMTTDFNFNMVKDTINLMESGFKEKIRKLLKDPEMQYEMKDNEIMIE